MFTPIILACTASACIGVSGPAYPDEETCKRSAMEQGIMFVQQTFPGYQPVDYKCVAWGTDT